ncbi:MAG: hypothetical protein AABW65_02995 [Nanoarchaeota archaeon]|mgnify:FL=1
MEEENNKQQDKKTDERNIKEEKQDKKVNTKIKKEEAVARGLNLHTSKKHCMYICSFIKNKPVDLAISQLQEVINFKRTIPFKGEIPHRKGDLMSGRYPVKASKLFISILKALRGNILSNNMDLENSRIYFCSANWASRPSKKGGMRFKRASVILKAKEFQEVKNNG